jgi:hypothetical protein
MSLVKVFTDDGIDAFCSIDDLFVEQWVSPGHPQGNIMDTSIGRASITTTPDSGIPLTNSFTMFFVNQALPISLNETIKTMKGELSWRGPVLVLKNRGSTENIENVQMKDFATIQDLLTR